MEDGGLTIEFLKTKPWCNGKIAFYGLSYVFRLSLANPLVT